MGPCQKFKKCKDCKTVYRTIKEHLHTCGERYCNLCQRWHVSTKECFIQPVIKKHGFYSYKRILVFDLEVCFFKNMNFIYSYIFYRLLKILISIKITH